MATYTLFYVPGVCSLSPHVTLREGNFDFDLQSIDLKNNKKTQAGEDFWALNPKGYVPALRIPGGKILTEGAIVVQYLADQKPEAKLAPPNGTLERYELQEWMHFFATELHKGMSVFYQASAGDELRGIMKKRLDQRLGVLNKHLATRKHVMGDQFTVADPYAFYCLRAFQKQVKGTLDGALAEYYQRLAQRPSVKAALEFEKLDP